MTKKIHTDVEIDGTLSVGGVEVGSAAGDSDQVVLATQIFS